MASRQPRNNFYIHSLVPVGMDVLFKFWVFKYLRKLAPSTQIILEDIVDIRERKESFTYIVQASIDTREAILIGWFSQTYLLSYFLFVYSISSGLFDSSFGIDTLTLGEIDYL